MDCDSVDHQRVLVLFGLCISPRATEVFMPLGLCVILVDFFALRAVTLWTLVGSDAFGAE